MSKKNKNKKEETLVKETVNVDNNVEAALQELSDQAQELALDGEVNPLVKETVEEVKPEVKVEAKPVVKKIEVEMISLQDAARRYVIGYKEYWLPSMQKYASSLGYGSHVSVEDSKEILKRWGAKLK